MNISASTVIYKYTLKQLIVPDNASAFQRRHHQALLWAGCGDTE